MKRFVLTKELKNEIIELSKDNHIRGIKDKLSEDISYFLIRKFIVKNKIPYKKYFPINLKNDIEDKIRCSDIRTYKNLKEYINNCNALNQLPSLYRLINTCKKKNVQRRLIDDLLDKREKLLKKGAM